MKISGEIVKIKYRNEENGYTVLQIKGCETVFTLIGNFPFINEGLFIDAEVNEVNNEYYGIQYNVISYNMDIASNDDNSIINFLISLKVKGVGEKTCERIVNLYGKDTIDIIKNNQEKLISIKGLNIERIKQLHDKLIEKSSDIDLILKISKFKLPNSMVKKIIDYYGEKACDAIEENPYELALNIEGIGFETCDKLARIVGISEDSDERIKAAIIHILNMGVADGNVFLTYNELVDGLNKLIGFKNSVNLIDIFNEMILKSLIVVVNGNIVKKDEKNNDKVKNKNIIINNIEENSINKYSENDDNIYETNDFNKREENKLIFLKSQYSVEKKLAEILYSRKEDIKIITGGPGTGKTYNINKYLKEAESISLNVILCAPTGRAAKRIEEVTGHKAKTIHRLLECQKIKDTSRVYFAKNEENKLDCDVIIVDEMSMVDEYIMLSLIKAVPEGAKIILVGDIDQLPSVGAGQVLKDMIDSKYFEVMRLTKIYRQKESSNIVKNAHAVNKNEKINFDKDFNDFKFVNMSTEDKINNAIKTLVKDKIPKFFDIDYSDIQVLCPSKMYKCGVDNINNILQNALNPEDIKKQEIKIGSTIFREGDKVIQNANNYDIPYDEYDDKGKIIDYGNGIFNGDIGVINNIDEDLGIIEVAFDNKIATYGIKESKDLALAYAITVHKSQGSEYKVVVMPMAYAPKFLLNKKILYTAMTRAKKCICFVGSMEIFNVMCNNNYEQKRNSALLSNIYRLEL